MNHQKLHIFCLCVIGAYRYRHQERVNQCISLTPLNFHVTQDGGALITFHFVTHLNLPPVMRMRASLKTSTTLGNGAPAFAFLNFIEAHFPYHQLPPEYLGRFTDTSRGELQTLTDAHNKNQGTALTVADWIALLVKERAIGDELSATADQLRRQAETDATASFEAAVKAERDRLLATL